MHTLHLQDQHDDEFSVAVILGFSIIILLVQLLMFQVYNRTSV